MSACIGSVCKDGAWQCGGDFGVWTLQHTKPRRHLGTPRKITLGATEPQRNASMRLTRGVFTSDSTPFTRFDNSRNIETAHLDMLDHWIGTTTDFEYNCANMDDHMQQLCALHDSDAHMSPVSCVTFDDANNTYYDITSSPLNMSPSRKYC